MLDFFHVYGNLRSTMSSSIESENLKDYFHPFFEQPFHEILVSILSWSFGTIMRTWMNLWDWKNRQPFDNTRSCLGFDCPEIYKKKGLFKRSSQFFF